MKYDFHISSPGQIENKIGRFFRLPIRCWIILSHAVCEPLGFEEAEELLNQALDQQNGQNEIILDENAIEYIVSKTNAVLGKARSTWRLSAASASFSMRKNPTDE